MHKFVFSGGFGFVFYIIEYTLPCRTYSQIHKCIEGWMDGWTEERNGYLKGWIEEGMDKSRYGWREERKG